MYVPLTRGCSFPYCSISHTGYDRLHSFCSTTGMLWMMTVGYGDMERTILSSHSQVWFPQAILRLSFITWLAFRDRLSTDIYIYILALRESLSRAIYVESLMKHMITCSLLASTLTLWIDLVGFILGQREWILTRLSQIHNGMIFTSTPSAGVCLLKLALQATIHI